MNSTHLNNPVVSSPANVDSTISNDEYAQASQLLIRQGYCVLTAPPTLQAGFQNIVSAYAEVPTAMKQSFSFPLLTDGFFPFGMEKTTEIVDLCERFCFRQENRLEHQGHPFAQSPMYVAAAVCEMMMSALAHRLIQEITKSYECHESIQIRDSSYLQLCNYEARFRSDDREFMQERHEDGDLITLVMQTQDGLVLFPNGNPFPIHLEPNQLVVFTGSLLRHLSDHRIPHTDHAVKRPPQNKPRCSLIYFTLPELTKTYESFVERRKVCLGPLANELHKSFGNYEFKGVAP